MDKQLLAAQPVALLLGRQQGADEIVPRLAPPGLYDGLEIGEQLPGGAPDVLDLRAREDRLDDERDIVGPGFEPVHVLGRHAQHLGDHGHRQRVAEGGDQVEAVAVGDRVQKPVGDLPHAALPARHRARRERPGDQRAQPRVVRRVDVQHGGQAGIVKASILGAEALVVAQHGVHVLVAGQDPGIDQPHAVNRIPVPQPAIDRVGVPRDLVRDGIVGNPGFEPLAGEQRLHDDRPEKIADSLQRIDHRPFSGGQGRPAPILPRHSPRRRWAERPA